MASDRTASPEDRISNVEYATDVFNLLKRVRKVQ
jgi:hypothetical protein